MTLIVLASTREMDAFDGASGLSVRVGEAHGRENKSRKVTPSLVSQSLSFT